MGMDFSSCFLSSVTAGPLHPGEGQLAGLHRAVSLRPLLTTPQPGPAGTLAPAEGRSAILAAQHLQLGFFEPAEEVGLVSDSLLV